MNMFKRFFIAFFAILISEISLSAQNEFVDLGLSVEWATCNLGASSPEETGSFFSWGETSPKKDYSKENHVYYLKLNSLFWCLWKYDSQYHNILEPEDDAATVILGSNCHTPTLREFKELIAKCRFDWTERNKVQGYLVTGPNGQSIFLPQTGCMQGTKLANKDRGYYLSSILIKDDKSGALWFIKNGDCDVERSSKDEGVPVAHGFPIRPVRTKTDSK